MTKSLLDRPPIPTSVRRPPTYRSLVGAVCLLWLCACIIGFKNGNQLSIYMARDQDLAILLALVPMLLILGRWAPAWRLPTRAPRLRILIAAGLVIAAVLAWATHAVLWNFPVSRDEDMVRFDMAVYDRGRLAAALPELWRDYATALVPDFLLNSDRPIGVVSAYLPVNAMMRLAFSYVADPALFNPLLVLAGGVALFDIAKRLFAEDARARWVVLLVYGCSSQMLVTAMTAYAMTAHMALNLIWLAAFLRGGRIGHAAAIASGFLAVGLHQLVFHPLFAAPFIFWRWRQGDWRIALLYGAAYALILAWWMAFPHLAAQQAGVPAAAPAASDFLNRMHPLLVHRDPLTLWFTMLNLARFVAWQNLALLPLVLAGLPGVWRGQGPQAPLFWGIAGATVFMAFVQPYQGHGWGYRYLHPYLGSFALLAGFGYRRLAEKARQRTEGMIVALSLLTVLGSFPFLLWRAREFTRPHVALDRHIAAQQADFVLVDTGPTGKTTDGGWANSPVDEVRNDPDLTNRPIRLSSRGMDEWSVLELCNRGTVSVVTWQDMHALGFGRNVPGSTQNFEDLKFMLRDSGCLVR